MHVASSCVVQPPKAFDEVHGDVHFGNMDHKLARRYRQQIALNTEGTFRQALCSSQGEGCRD